MRRLLIALTALVLGAPLAGAPHAAAQARPAVPAAADPNDWESYFDLGERMFDTAPSQADTVFAWAARLDPTRAEPLMARWAVFYARDEGLWINYLNDDERTLRRPDVIMNEERLRLAQVRNPFVHRGLEAALLSMLGRRLLWDRSTEAFLAYGRGDFRRAATNFAALVRANPRRNFRLRHYRALSLVGAGQPDSAAVEIERLLTALRQSDAEEVGDAYESRALWEHALGMIHETTGDTARARREYERALAEDRAWYAARMGLARLDLRGGNAEAAVAHLAAAAEIAPGDGVVRLEYGNALAAAGRVPEALAQFRAALEREPDWAEVYLRLGWAHDTLGEAAQAAAMYRGYLERAPRRQGAGIEAVTRRLGELQPPS
jgi:tetratricopeptide (TPR) repeat protein